MVDKPTARDWVLRSRSNGISVADIARQLDRSPRMVNKILRGETKGDLYINALRDLATKGTVKTPPQRRRDGGGKIIPVRTKAGSAEKSYIPVDKSERYTKEKQGGRFQEATIFYGGGTRQHELNIPKGKKTKGRGEASTTLLGLVRRAARGQTRKTQQRVTLDVTFANGRQMQIKDYNASSLLNRIKTQGGGDAFAWIGKAQKDRYPDFDPAAIPVTGITMTVYQSTNHPGASRPYPG